jgi:putative transposase
MTERVVKRAYKYRFYPTPEQAQELKRTFGCVRKVYNLAHQERTRAWYQEQHRVSYADTSALLTGWKKDPHLAYLSEVSSIPLQQGLRHLQTAYAAFWAKRARYPRFKSKRKSRASAEYSRSGFRFKAGQLTLAKMTDPLDIVWSRPLPEGAEPSTVTASVDTAGRWHVSILVEDTITTLTANAQTVGVDAGITTLLTLSTGEKVSNLRHERADRVRLAKAQREHARKQKGSSNKGKARLKVGKVYARIADRRRDHLHKVTTRLVRENQTIVIEDLAVRTMVRSHSLARAISDAAWRDLRGMLEYKTDWYGRELVVADRWFPSSKVCSACGVTTPSMPVSSRDWVCPSCGAAHDRDVNAAKNIRSEGLSVIACGDGMRPTRH